jgi:translation initiation factor IF-2
LSKRVFQLAKELEVTSKSILEKCRAEGLEIKNHMSTVSVGLEATIREWFSEAGGSSTAVEETEHVDLKKVRRKPRRKKKKAEDEAAVEEGTTETAVAVEEPPADKAEQEEAAPAPEDEPVAEPAEEPVAEPVAEPDHGTSDTEKPEAGGDVAVWLGGHRRPVTATVRRGPLNVVELHLT